MTGEMHTKIIQAGMRALLELTPEQLRAYEPWLTRKQVIWCLENPRWTNPADEEAMEIIRSAAALIKTRGKRDGR